jgi:hypothetical protein
MSRKINHNWNSDIRIKDHYGATNGFVSSYVDGLGRGETCVFGVNGGTGDSKFLSRLVNWNIDQHNHFMGKKDPKVGLHKNNQFIAVEHFEFSSIPTYPCAAFAASWQHRPGRNP